jgi:hypothetical protein
LADGPVACDDQWEAVPVELKSGKGGELWETSSRSRRSRKSVRQPQPVVPQEEDEREPEEPVQVKHFIYVPIYYIYKCNVCKVFWTIFL